ncbi:TonB-dependent receptor plug domain-containing protein [Parahaliea maris]|uniref:TonB-dependent receptor plug domain-containing protein n=1 Tax=Parahaliea maris TaxID=2716870 RepID=A0A5C8ZTU0_9GAMM|nr:TonB-dependent receptor [Parahaliea maris]TXS91895.1 TonB-dependent receptor plug domain-containing protein [Parahaliea maris]
MMKKTRLFTVLASAGATLASAPATTLAQTAPAGAMLEEVLVTAQRREQNLLDLPLSATALSGEALKNRGVTRIMDLQTATPSLSLTDTGPTLTANIRGIGIATNTPNITPGVAVYVDGLFQPPIVQSSSFYDIASVEVLRGPQGTFVGNNATGGAIFINSKDPVLEEFGGYAELEAGNFSRWGLEAGLNVPVSDNLALRLAGFTTDRDSYYDDIGPFDNEAGKLEEYSARLGVLWSSGAFEALLKAQVNHRDTGGYPAQPVPGTSYAPFRTGDAFTLEYDTPVSYEDEGEMVSLKLDWEIAGGITLRSLSGYQDKTIDNEADVDASSAPIQANGDISELYHANEKQWSQEFNIISPTEGRFDWIVGAYYQENEIRVPITDTQAGFITDIFGGNDRKVTGLFAQANYRLLESLEVEAGIRRSTYDVEGFGGIFIGRGIPVFPPGGLQVADLSGDYDDSQTTGKVALNWYLGDSLIYGLVSTGYKPGGFNSATSQFDKEEVINYEAGWKFSLMDDRVRTQLSAFYTDYSDFQYAVLEPSTGVEGSENLADMTIQGMEAQVQARFGGLTISATAGYIDSDIGGQRFVNVRALPGTNLGPQCPPGQPSAPPQCFDYSLFVVETDGGNALFAPEWTYNLALAYDLNLPGGMLLTPRLQYSHVDEQFTYLAYSPVSDVLDARDLLNASLTLAGERWTAEIYGTNLTDEEYVSGQFLTTEFYGAPREYGVRVGFRF